MIGGTILFVLTMSNVLSAIRGLSIQRTHRLGAHFESRRLIGFLIF